MASGTSGDSSQAELPACFGLDLGSGSFSLGHWQASSGTVELLLNDLGGRSTPVLVSFQGRRRLVGNAAVDLVITNAPNTITRLAEALTADAVAMSSPAAMADVTVTTRDSEPRFEVSYDHAGRDKHVFSTTQLLAMVFAPLRSQLAQHGGETSVLAVALPDRSLAAGAAEIVSSAAAVAQLPGTIHVVSASQCLGASYAHRHRFELVPALEAGAEGEQPQALLLLDVGQSQTQVVVVRQQGQRLAIAGCEGAALGGSDFDRCLCEALLVRLKDQHKVTVAVGSRHYLRLLKEAAKARTMLSGNTSCDVVLEAFGEDGGDYRLQLTREQMHKALKPLAQQLESVIRAALDKHSVVTEGVAGVELVGGVTCSPLIMEAVTAVVGEGKIRTTMDRASALTVGATKVAAQLAQDKTAAAGSSLSGDRLEAARSLEASMQAQDNQIRATQSARNALEACIFETRGHMNGTHSKLIDAEKTRPLLDAAEEWLYSEEAESAQEPEVYTGYQEKLETQLKSVNAAFYEGLAQEAEEKAKRAAEERQRWEAEAATQNKDDHDFRPMKKADRMKYVIKNKEEATELFKDGNYQHATERYVRALGHSNKFVDLTPEDAKEVKDLQLALHLNLAMCYIKMSAWKKALAEANEALALDNNSAKGWFRKANALENLKDYPEGLKAAKQAAQLAPEDAASTKLVARLEAKHKASLEEEKKKYAKMFG